MAAYYDTIAQQYQNSKEKKEEEYVSSLEDFLEASKEDVVDIDGILKQLPIYAYPLLQTLKYKGSGRIIDIGSGNGAKAIYLARRLQQIRIEVTVDLIEPKAEQIRRLVRNYRGENQKYLGNIYQSTLGELQLDDHYDLALVIHSLYEFPRDNDETILSLDKLGQLVSVHGSGVIITEHSEGDFQKMKRELYPAFGKKAPLSSDIIARSLEKFKIPFRVGDKIESQFNLDSLIDKSPIEIGKNMAFLFSDSLNDEPLHEASYIQIGEWVKENIRQSNGHSYLWTPDITLWTFNKCVDYS